MEFLFWKRAFDGEFLGAHIYFVIDRRFSSRSRVYGSLVIPKQIDKSKVMVMRDVCIEFFPFWRTFF